VITEMVMRIINWWRLMRYGRGRFPNIKKPVVVVRHEDLERLYDESSYKRKCPKCKDGILFVRREAGTLVIVASDICCACGQRFIYSDVEEMKKNDWLSPTGGSHESNKKNGCN